MNNFVFYSPTEFVFGKATEMQVGALARKHGARKVMIVYGGGSVVRSGLLDRVKQSLREAGIEYCLMGGVQPNPVDTKVYEGIEFCRREQADMLLPVGGGSVIDTAKAIAAGVLYEGDFWDFYIGKAKVTKALKVAVVLTIPAAGSEGSGNTVITKLDGLQKLSLRVPEVLRPVFSIMNPELTYTLLPFQTACGVADMMAHIMERYFTNTAFVDFGDRMAEGVMKSMMKYMKLIKEDPENYDYRAEIMWGCKAAQDDFIGVGREQCWESHLLQRDIGSICMDSSHGAGLAVVVPHWMRHVYKVNVPRFAEWANRVMDVEVNTFDLEATALEGIDRLAAFIKSVGLPTTLRELGVSSKDDIEVMANKAYPAGTETLGGFSHMTRKDFVEILTAAF